MKVSPGVRKYISFEATDLTCWLRATQAGQLALCCRLRLLRNLKRRRRDPLGGERSSTAVQSVVK